MTSPHRHDDHTDSDRQRRRWPGRRRLPPVRWTATITAALLGLALIAAGRGGSSNGPGVAGGGSKTTHEAASTGSASGSPTAQLVAFSRCMRSHGIADYPDPTTSGGAVGITLHGGPGSDLNRDNPRFKAAKQACQSLQPGGSQGPTQSAQKIAAEVTWARCMRSHGLPSFPDPNGQGVFDRSKFDENSTAFQTASNACKSLRPGPLPVH